jgi:TIR domain
MAFDVFLSYAHDDKPVADAACAVIENAGIRCWIAPRDIAPGADYAAALMEALESCKALVLIFSGSANQSPHIRREVERAVSRGIPLIPVRIENIEPSAALKYFVGSVHWLDALTPPLEAHLAHLAATLSVILNQQTHDAARPARVPSPADPPMSPHLFRARAAGVGCFACGGINVALLVMLHDAIDLLLAVVCTALFYVLVFRNLTRDLVMARTILIVLTAVLAVSWLNVTTQGIWLFTATEGINLMLALWMIYEINAMIGKRGS